MSWLDELEKLHAAGTQGPWSVEHDARPGDDPGYIGIGVGEAEMGDCDGSYEVAASDAFNGKSGLADARLIAAMRNALPRLLAATRYVNALEGRCVCSAYLPDIGGDGPIAMAVRRYEEAHERLRVAHQALLEACK